MLYIDSSFKVIDAKMIGRKPKKKLKRNNRYYIFKYGCSYNEIIAELVAEEIGLQMGIEMAHYEIAEFNGIIGLLTPNFLNFKENELIMSSALLRESVQFMFDENNINIDLRENTVENIITSAITYDDKIDREQLTYELMNRWVFYGLIMESDKNESNISFIKNPNKILRLSPDYDNSTMARMDENVSSFWGEIIRGYLNIYQYTDNIKSALKLTREDEDEFIRNFPNFIDNYPHQSEKIMKYIYDIDVSLAISNVEELNDITIPWGIKAWLEKAISLRKEDLINIYNKRHLSSKIKKKL